MKGGYRGLTDPLRLGDGTTAAPTYSFASENGLGLGRNAAGVGAFIAGAAQPSGWNAAGLVLHATAGFLQWASTNLSGASDVLLNRGAAGVLELKNGTNAQELRIYGTTTGPKYLSLKHDGTNGVIGLTGTGVLSITTDISPSTDNARNIGTAALRISTVNAVQHNCYLAASDAVPSVQLVAGSPPILWMGPGGAGAVDLAYSRQVTNAGSYAQIASGGTLTGSPTDFPGLEIAPTIAGAFTVTRFAYLKCTQTAGAATVTDGSLAWFNAAIGTHKALASNGAVASVFTANAGPTGAGTAIAGWVKWNINGTLRYTPFW